jgi:hypothetical protein
MKKLILATVILSAMTIFSSCDKHDEHDHDDDHNHGNELITTIRFVFTDTTSGSVDTFSWKQPKGPGTPITLDTIRLTSGTSYAVRVEVLDESKSPAQNISNEIAQKAKEHRFVYTVSSNRIQLQITDFDTHNPPLELGLKLQANVGVSGDSTATWRAVLKHYSTAVPKTQGPAAGSTDIDVLFPVLIQ